MNRGDTTKLHTAQSQIPPTNLKWTQTQIRPPSCPPLHQATRPNTPPKPSPSPNRLPHT